MHALQQIYRRLNEAQKTLRFRIVCSALALLVCIGAFGALLTKSYDLEHQRQTLRTALEGQSLSRGDALVVNFQETGEIVVNGRRYGGERFLLRQSSYFDQAGNLVAVPMLVEELLRDQRPTWAPGWLLEQPGTTWLLAVIFTIWLQLIVWMQITIQFLLTLAGTSAIVAWCWWTGRPQGMVAFGGMGLLIFTFVLLTRIALIALHPPYQVLAVAHTVVKEASRTRLSLVFIVVLLVILPLLPLWLDPSSPLRYRIQTFLSYSLGLTFSIAACMTLVLACASVAFEIRDRQIWQLMTKPVGRLNYLLGKWLGIMTVNLILLVMAGVSTFTFVQYLKMQPVAEGITGVLDSLAVSDEVLTARKAARPAYRTLSPEELRSRVDQRIQNDSQLSQLERVPPHLRLAIERELQNTYMTRQRSIPPWDDLQRDPPSEVYTFTGLAEAKKLGATLTLRYRFHILSDDEHAVFYAGFIFNDDPQTRHEARYVPTMTHTLPLGPHLIKDDGTLTVRIYNLHRPPPSQRGIGSLNFDENEFEVLYKAGNFEGNFVRAMLTMWIKLAFLAAMGVCCATFLNFPVACLLSFTIFFAALLGPFLSQALEWYYPIEMEYLDWSNVGAVVVWAFEWCTRGIASMLVFLLRSFGEYQLRQNLIQGRLIEWRDVLSGALTLVMLWSGMAMTIGWLVLRKRQLAIYSGVG